MGNGAKAQQKRERAKNKGKPKPKSGSTLKSNVEARTIQCTVCKQTFFSTMRKPALEEHASNRHSKTLDICFPSFSEENSDSG